MNNDSWDADYRAVIAGRQERLDEELRRILPVGVRFLWEVGCGHGHFLTAYAAAHPSKICIGIDLVGERIERARRKRERARLPHLHFIRAEARLFLHTLPPGSQISELFILFPDPWPKSRHHKHRVLQPVFLSAAARRATPDCRLYFRTDHGPYFEEARAAIRDCKEWALVDEPWPFEFETVFQQRAERHESLIARLRPLAP